MSGVDSSAVQVMGAVGVFVSGGVFTALLKFGFDRIGAHLGWSREDKRDQDGKIERMDSHARAEVARIERALGDRLNTVESDVGILKEKIEHLPTDEDIARLAEGLARVDRGLGGVQAKVDGMNTNLQTVLQHILAGERRG